MDEKLMMSALDFCYDKAVNGVPGFDSAEELAQSYSKGSGKKSHNAENLVNWQVAKCSTSGFLTGIGGIITLPIAIPANIISVLSVQTRMIAAVACIGEHDIQDDRVKTLTYMCLCGNALADVAKNAGIQIGAKLTTAAIAKISGATITKINQAVGFRLLTKFGQTGVVNLGKAVPLLGGVVGATFDGVTTKKIGKIAIETFLD
jgi:EcsC protein family